MLTNEQLVKVFNGKPVLLENSIHIEKQGTYYYFDVDKKKVHINSSEYEKLIKLKRQAKRLCKPTFRLIELFREAAFFQDSNDEIYRLYKNELEFVTPKSYDKRVKSFHRRSAVIKEKANETETVIRLG